ncbi:hypothetical protein LWI29_028769 [Acer saccharum]|uniref:Uncharacterized protein n=1 Tax=Acer saccharum TaxID=4024 RepID=A0AA39T6W9_ACESA|nr:hypothetical protein LWI29_028769 [Acer saccharum]
MVSTTEVQMNIHHLLHALPKMAEEMRDPIRDDGHKQHMKLVYSKPSVEVRIPSKTKKRSSRSGVATPSKASGLPSKSTTFRQGKDKKKRKRSSSTYLASSGCVGLATSIVDSLHIEEDKEGEGDDLVFTTLGERQAKKRKGGSVLSGGLVPSTSLRIGHTLFLILMGTK